MGLFQRQPIREEYTLPYRIGTSVNRTMLIVGLGNPGTKYIGTRHNIGFDVVDSVATSLSCPAWKHHKDFQADVTDCNAGGNRILLAKPHTFMNDSGISVRAIAQFYKLNAYDIVVIHDELSLPFGQIRARIGGQSAGHNGIKSIISHIGSNFGRIRIGIKNQYTPKDDTKDFVLQKFSKEEKKYISSLITEAALFTSEYIYSGQLTHETRTIIID